MRDETESIKYQNIQVKDEREKQLLTKGKRLKEQVERE